MSWDILLQLVLIVNLVAEADRYQVSALVSDLQVAMVWLILGLVELWKALILHRCLGLLKLLLLGSLGQERLFTTKLRAET